MPVRARVTVFYAVIMCVVVAAGGFFLLSRMRSEVRSAIDAGLRSRAAIVARDVVEEFGDVGADEGVIDESEVVAQILEPGGRVLESTPPIGDEPLVSGDEISSLGRSGTVERTVRVNEVSEAMRLFVVRTPNNAVVVVGASMAEAHQAVGTLTRLLLIGGPILLLVTSGAVWLLAGLALRPVERMRSEAEALSFGIDGKRLAVPATRDEVARLGETLNLMLARLEQALDRERRFVDDASHELRTPLAVLKTELELALRGSRSTGELEAAIRSAADEVDNLARLSEHLLLLARADRGLLATQRSRLDVGRLVSDVRAGFDARAQDQVIDVITNAGGPVWAEADPLLLRQAVSNLIDNALKHTPAGGRITIDVETEDSETQVVVSDSGPGFDPGLLPKAFDAFTRANGARGRGSGAGLGLAIVRAVAEAHGGEADATNPPGGGARVTLRFPS